MAGKLRNLTAMNPDESKRFVIAMDGPAGSGKSTVASMVAQKLDFVHADSGAMYRTLTLELMERLGAGCDAEEFGKSLIKSEKLKQISAADLSSRAAIEDGKQKNLIGDQDVGAKIRTPEVTERIRFIADDRDCRSKVNAMLRDFAAKTNLLVDGRDIGTEVFPEADYKFFLTADCRVRAERRLSDFAERGFTEGGGVSEIESESDGSKRREEQLRVLEGEIRARDERDENRAFGSLKRADDAILIDTSAMDINAAVSAVLSYMQIKF